MDEHYFHKMTNAWIMCKCGKKFFDSKTKTAAMKLDEHIIDNKRTKGENNMVCDNCPRDIDFELITGEKLCAWCMVDLAEDSIEQKAKKRQCPECGKYIPGDKFLEHMVLDHDKKSEQ